jgi:metal-dependent amidase/aminoacylase/carboxypeptidase family protein
MIKEGGLFGVDECYGCHNLPLAKEGVLLVKSKLVMVGAAKFFITITGKGGHSKIKFEFLL